MNARWRLFIFWACFAGDVSVFASSAALIASPEAGWPQFRGPRRDGISDERGLLATWPAGGPKLLWSAKGVTPKEVFAELARREGVSGIEEKKGRKK